MAIWQAVYHIRWEQKLIPTERGSLIRWEFQEPHGGGKRIAGSGGVEDPRKTQLTDSTKHGLRGFIETETAVTGLAQVCARSSAYIIVV